MIITFTRMVLPLLGITFGFFIGCSTLSPSTQKPVNPDDLSKQELRVEINSIDQQISSGSADADLYYQKGYLLSQYALKLEKPSDRTATYEDLQNSLQQAERLFNEANLPSGKQKVDELLKVTWSSEHNMGVQIMQSDSTLEEADLEEAAVHFKNATRVLPDTAISYKMEARAYYKNGKNREALQALEEAKQEIDSLPAEMLEQLAYLYLETGQPSKAVQIYEEAETAFTSGNLNVIHGLANAYISSNDHVKAVSLLNELVENEPDNIIYAQTLATEYYRLGSSKLSELTRRSNSNLSNRELLEDADSLFTRARRQLESSISGETGNQELQEALVSFYQNAASKYQSVLPEVTESEKTEIREIIRDYLSSSIPVYEELVEEYPDASRNYWKNLYEAYSYLGMSEKAEEAKSKFN
ncbi:tetratricopeptide repeat protein [Balneolaceae bacterium YR4-1]|uniref:Tetratricopeptide repeat protein n=1 Tax=Halalkalibaculum roseum TaxID=2709311 RepID=A0A6M1SSP4_9BACT|nr:tetratricopeptide repeat protein [Halalkalibaculum roseum]NGP75890.1 tetratricopeptide repeat protein [Halalkalibaculum roseum]